MAPNFFFFLLLVIISPLVHIRHRPREAFYNPDQAAHYHILGHQVRGFISDQALG
jgi:hypothetical protein